MSQVYEELKKYLDITSAMWGDYAKLGKALLEYLFSEQDKIPYDGGFDTKVRELFLAQINQPYPLENEFAEIVLGMVNVSAYYIVENPYSYITGIDHSDIEDVSFAFLYGKRFADVCSHYSMGYNSRKVDEVFSLLFKDAPDHIFSKELSLLPPDHHKMLRCIDEQKTAALIKI